MTPDANQMEVYLEIGKVRTLAVSVDWPGWCRSGRDESSAMQALIDYGPRYAKALQDPSLNFHAPPTISSLLVVERLQGTATTDFGAPDLSLARDTLPVGAIELERMNTLLDCCWNTFDKTIKYADGRELSKGPRGGGRELKRIYEHIRDSEIEYLNRLGAKFIPGTESGPDQVMAAIRQTILTTLTLSTQGEIPTHGPRGGLRWSPRYFMRRLVWHLLDHVWEIEDRVI